jgi:predicted RNA binding protein YcfA (HicA-like mRNA interferase family)
MSKRKKRLERLRQNPKNVSLDDLQIVLEDYGFEFKQTVGSHHTFSVEIGGKLRLLVIPFRRPVKPIYVKKALKLIDQIIIQNRVAESEDEPDTDDSTN